MTYVTFRPGEVLLTAPPPDEQAHAAKVVNQTAEEWGVNLTVTATVAGMRLNIGPGHLYQYAALTVADGEPTIQFLQALDGKIYGRA